MLKTFTIEFARIQFKMTSVKFEMISLNRFFWFSINKNLTLWTRIRTFFNRKPCKFIGDHSKSPVNWKTGNKRKIAIDWHMFNEIFIISHKSKISGQQNALNPFRWFLLLIFSFHFWHFNHNEQIERPIHFLFFFSNLWFVWTKKLHSFVVYLLLRHTFFVSTFSHLCLLFSHLSFFILILFFLKLNVLVHVNNANNDKKVYLWPIFQ